MGLFGSREEIRDVATEDVAIPEDVGRVIPDVGEYFLWWLGPINDSTLDEVATHVNALRGENGWISLNEADQFGINKWENGPLTFLTYMTAFDGVTASVWANHGLRGAEKRAVNENVESVLQTQGHAAAAAWAIAARPDAGRLDLDLDLLADQLLSSWSKQLQYRSNGDVIKAFKKWRR